MHSSPKSLAACWCSSSTSLRRIQPARRGRWRHSPRLPDRSARWLHQAGAENPARARRAAARSPPCRPWSRPSSRCTRPCARKDHPHRARPPARPAGERRPPPPRPRPPFAHRPDRPRPRPRQTPRRAPRGTGMSPNPIQQDLEIVSLITVAGGLLVEYLSRSKERLSRHKGSYASSAPSAGGSIPGFASFTWLATIFAAGIINISFHYGLSPHHKVPMISARVAFLSSIGTGIAIFISGVTEKLHLATCILMAFGAAIAGNVLMAAGFAIVSWVFGGDFLNVITVPLHNISSYVVSWALSRCRAEPPTRVTFQQFGGHNTIFPAVRPLGGPWSWVRGSGRRWRGRRRSRLR